jgi:hypothetical protein
MKPNEPEDKSQLPDSGVGFILYSIVVVLILSTWFIWGFFYAAAGLAKHQGDSYLILYLTTILIPFIACFLCGRIVASWLFHSLLLLSPIILFYLWVFTDIGFIEEHIPFVASIMCGLLGGYLGSIMRRKGQSIED